MPKLIIKTQMVRCSDDLEVSFRPWGSPKFGGLPIVAVHGDWATSATWTRLASELTERWIVAPDMRGRGQTRAPDHGYSVAELSADLLAFLDAQQLGKAHLIGHGLGAAVAAELGLRAPQRVASLTLVSPPWVDGMPEALADPAVAQSYKSSARTFSQALASQAPKAPRDILWVGLIEAGYKQRLEAALGAQTALVAWQPGDRLAELSMPRRVVDGELDQLTGGDVAARAAQALGCARVTIRGAGQQVQLDDPEALAELVRKLIAEAGG